MTPDLKSIAEAERLALRARRSMYLATLVPLALWAVGLVLLTVNQSLFWAASAVSLLALYVLDACVVQPRIRAARTYSDSLRKP